MNHGEDWFGEDIKDTVKDHFGVRRDDISAVCQTPCHRINEPEEGQDDSRSSEGSSVPGSKHSGGLTSWSSENPPDVDDYMSVIHSLFKIARTHGQRIRKCRNPTCNEIERDHQRDQ